MSDLRRIDEVIPILKSILYEDSASMGPTQTFNKDVVEHIKHVIEKEGNEEMKLDFNRIEKHFVQQNHISDMVNLHYSNNNLIINKLFVDFRRAIVF